MTELFGLLVAIAFIAYAGASLHADGPTYPAIVVLFVGVWCLTLCIWRIVTKDRNRGGVE